MPTPQVGLDPHAYDDKSGIPSTGTDAALRSVVIDMLKQGHSDEDVRQFIHKVDVAHMSVAGQYGQAFADHIGPALLTGLIGTPLMVKDAVVDGLSMLQGKSPTNAKAFVDSLAALPEKWKTGTPYDRAAMATDLGGSLAVGGAEGGGLFAARKPLARAAGATLSEAASHPGAVRLASGGAILHGVYNGNPTEMAAGLVGSAVPSAVDNVGQWLYAKGADGAKYVTRKERAAAQAAEDAKLPSSVRDIDTGPVNSLNLAPPTSGPQGSSRVPQVGMPATANTRVQKVMADEAKSESAVAGRQAIRASGANAIPVPDGLSDAEATQFREVKASNPQIPDRMIVQSIRGTNASPIASAAPAGRPAIRVSESAPAAAAGPVERRKSVGSKAPKLQETDPGTDSLSTLMDAMHGEDAVLPGNGSGGGTAVLERPAVAPATGVPANYMTEDDVAGIGDHAREMGDKTLNTLRKAGREVPDSGLQSTEDIDRATGVGGNLTDSPAFKDLQESIRQSRMEHPTPSNLQMGSEASPKEIAAEVRMRVQGGGGIRLSGSKPGETVVPVKLKAPSGLTDEQQQLVDIFSKKNPDMDPAAIAAFVQKTTGGDE